MVNHWTKIRDDRLKRLEEARLALQRWCNKVSYDGWGFYTSNGVSAFYQKYPQYIEFESKLKVNWNNAFKINSSADATGIPEVTIQEDD
jgi:hypothetical protein